MNEEPLLVLRPSFVNAFLPTLIKYILKIIFYIAVPIGAIYISLNVLQQTKMNVAIVMILFFLGSITLAILSLIIKVFVFTPKVEYRFYKHHLEVESKLLQIKKKSVPYNKITNINSEISLWDRMTNSGDLVIHTADENETGDIKILFLKNPLDLEKKIHALIVKTQRSK